MSAEEAFANMLKGMADAANPNRRADDLAAVHRHAGNRQ